MISALHLYQTNGKIHCVQTFTIILYIVLLIIKHNAYTNYSTTLYPSSKVVNDIQYYIINRSVTIRRSTGNIIYVTHAQSRYFVLDLTCILFFNNLIFQLIYISLVSLHNGQLIGVYTIRCNLNTYRHNYVYICHVSCLYQLQLNK